MSDSSYSYNEESEEDDDDREEWEEEKECEELDEENKILKKPPRKKSRLSVTILTREQKQKAIEYYKSIEEKKAERHEGKEWFPVSIHSNQLQET